MKPKDSTTPENIERRLDLGLSALLEAAAGNPIGDDSKLTGSEGSVISAEVPQTEEPQEIKKVELNEYELLAQSQQWEQLARLCETRITPGVETNLEAQLWWIRSEFQKKTMPVGIVAAPLESVTRALHELGIQEEPTLEENRQKLLVLSKDLLYEAGLQLKKGGDHFGACGYLETAWRMDASLAPELRNLVQTLKSEIEKNPRLRVDKVLQQRLERVGKIQLELGPEPIKSSSNPPTTKSVKSSLASTALGEASKLSSIDFPTESSADAALISYASNASANQSASIRRSILALFLILALVGVYPLLPAPAHETEGSAAVASEGSIQFVSHQDIVPALKIPEPQRLAPGKLDAIYYQIGEGTPGIASTTTVSQPMPVERVELDVDRKEEVPTASLTSPTSAGDISKAGQRLVVNTASPEEGAEFDSLSESEPVRERSPFERAGAVHKPRMPQSDSSRTRPRDPVMLDPEPILGYPVERFPGEGKEFSVIATTSVMSRPSYRSREVQTLDPGDSVSAVEKMGPWLKLRAKTGSVGYILAQDVVEDRVARR